MKNKKIDHPVQSAALPWRISDDGMRQVMPKGWPMKKRKAAEVASQEAYEEAGLIGWIVGKRPIGRFHYEKRLPKGTVLCEVRVYLFRVEQQFEDWPEKYQRTTQWFEANEASSLVEEGGLAEIITNFAGSYARFVAFRS
jgi:8-oxo-dGTP pyrophosphatase MutT (NUDIX family)